MVLIMAWVIYYEYRDIYLQFCLPGKIAAQSRYQIKRNQDFTITRIFLIAGEVNLQT